MKVRRTERSYYATKILRRTYPQKYAHIYIHMKATNVKEKDQDLKDEERRVAVKGRT